MSIRRNVRSLAVGSTVALLGLTTACSSDSNSSDNANKLNVAAPATPKAKIGVILPHNKPGSRWEPSDHKYFEEVFKASSVDYMIQNADNDKATFASMADQMISSGINVLIIVNVDAETSKAALAKAKAKSIATIDYDRLTVGGNADYYVSFDNAKVGQLQGEGLAKCLAAANVSKPVIAELNGSPTDNNATMFKNGYDSVLKPKYDSGEYVKGPDESVPGWDAAQATTIFEKMITANPNIGGVLAANDALGNAVVTSLKKHGRTGVPVTGQDATLQGLQNILAGDQCMTVYKDIKLEVDAAAKLAIGLAKGDKSGTNGTVKDTVANRDVPSFLLTPKAITKETVKDVVAARFVNKDELCAGAVKDLCTAAGIS